MALMLQVNASKSSGLAASNRRALYCAESGLNAGRTFILQTKDLWVLMLLYPLSGGKDDAEYPIRADIDVPADGVDDYEVTIRDDADVGDPDTDANGRVFIVSKCTKYSAYQAEIVELVDITSVNSTCKNRLQSGGCASKGGNVNQ